MGEGALQAGNSETIIRKHYLDLKTATEAEAFFGIMPECRRRLAVGNPTQAGGAVAPSLEIEATRVRAA
jgi:hypothetical protein